MAAPGHPNTKRLLYSNGAKQALKAFGRGNLALSKCPTDLYPPNAIASVLFLDTPLTTSESTVGIVAVPSLEGAVNRVVRSSSVGGESQSVPAIAPTILGTHLRVYGWVADSDVSECMNACGRDFTPLERRHHCRWELYRYGIRLSGRSVGTWNRCGGCLLIFFATVGELKLGSFNPNHLVKTRHFNKFCRNVAIYVLTLIGLSPLISSHSSISPHYCLTALV